MAVRKAPKTSKKTRRKGKALSPEKARAKRSELMRKVADIVIVVHRDALKELERH